MVDNPNNPNKDGGKTNPTVISVPAGGASPTQPGAMPMNQNVKPNMQPNNPTPQVMQMGKPAAAAPQQAMPMQMGKPAAAAPQQAMPMQMGKPAAAAPQQAMPMQMSKPAAAAPQQAMPMQMSKPAAAAPQSAQQAPQQMAGKDFQALMKEMQSGNQSRTAPVSGGAIDFGSSAAAGTGVAMMAEQPSAPQESNDDYYQDDYYAPPPVPPIMKLFFVVQTAISIVMVVLLVLMFNMFSSIRNQTITTDSMQAVLQSFVDGIANQNKALLDSFAIQMDEVDQTLATLNENNAKNQAAINGVSRKIDRAVRRLRTVTRPAPKPKPVVKPKAVAKPRVIPKAMEEPKAPVAPARTPTPAQQNNLPNSFPGLENLNNLPSLPSLPLDPQSNQNNLLNQSIKKTNATPNNQLQDSFTLPPLPAPTPNLFPNN